MRNKRELMEKLLSDSMIHHRKWSLAGLRDALDHIDFENDLEKNVAKGLVAIAHLCSFNNDRAQLSWAVEYYADMEDWTMMEKVLNVAKTYGQIRVVWRIKCIGQERSVNSLAVEDFEEWFKRVGILWYECHIDGEGEVLYISNEERDFLTEMIERSSSWDAFWKDVLHEVRANSGYDVRRMELLEKFSKKESLAVLAGRNPRWDADRQFRNYCQEHGIEIIEKLQQGIDDVRCCSNVYLVIDSDGIIKIYKELLFYDDGPIGHVLNREDEIYERLGTSDFIPRMYEAVTVGDGIVFMRQSFRTGQPLNTYVSRENHLEVHEICAITLRIAEKIKHMHACGVLHLDLKPENVLLDDDDVSIIDFGISRIVSSQQYPDAFLADPRYGTPECGMDFIASQASDVFQLGILCYEMLNGHHPFAIDSSRACIDREEMILNYFWPITSGIETHEYRADIAEALRNAVCSMLDHDPLKRMSCGSVIEKLSLFCTDGKVQQQGRGRKLGKENNAILFPARMSIPHKGHIEYMVRLLDLGYYLIISLQRSFTITDRDPIHKWFVMKMVAQSLMDRGFSTDDFHFVFTPLFETQAQMRRHFENMPDAEHVVGVASGNPSVHELFGNFHILDQRSLFGQEGVEYVDKTQGELLRRALRDSDREAFDMLAASGVEKILTFSELQTMYGKPHIEFVKGQVIVALREETGKEIIRVALDRYCSPQECIVKHLAMEGIEARLQDLYAKDDYITTEGLRKKISYHETVMQKDDEIITFILEEPDQS